MLLFLLFIFVYAESNKCNYLKQNIILHENIYNKILINITYFDDCLVKSFIELDKTGMPKNYYSFEYNNTQITRYNITNLDSGIINHYKYEYLDDIIKIYKNNTLTVIIQCHNDNCKVFSDKILYEYFNNTVKEYGNVEDCSGIDPFAIVFDRAKCPIKWLVKYNYTIYDHMIKINERSFTQTILFNQLNKFESYKNSNSYGKMFYLDKHHFTYIYNSDKYNEVEFKIKNGKISIFSKLYMEKSEIINNILN